MIFGEHVKHAIRKAESRIAALASILPNIGGPNSLKREILCGTLNSIILYGAFVWHEVIRIKRYEEMLVRLQRRALLRIASGYRTVSATAMQIITGIPPITMLIEERHRLYQLINGHTKEGKKKEREVTLSIWQDTWTKHEGTAEWTETLIPDLCKWVSCKHRKLD